MWKSFVMGAAALAVLGTTYLWAQPTPDQDGVQPPSTSGQAAAQSRATSDQSRDRRLQGLSREDANAFLEARIAGLHAGLQLNPDQERLWPAVEKAYRDFARLRIERRFAARASGVQQNEDPIARLQRRAAALTQEGAALKALADAAVPLWQSFDEGQKRRVAILLRAGRAAARDEGAARGFDGREGREGGRFGFGREGRGFDRDEGRFDRDGRGFGGPGRRDDDRFGYGRDGDRFRDGRGFSDRDGDRFGYGERGLRERFGYGRDGERFGGPRGFGDRFGYGRDGDRPGYGPRFGGPGDRYGDDYGRDRGFGPGDYGRGFDREPFRGRRDFDRRWRDERGSNDGELRGGPPGDRFSQDSDDDSL
jgi:zinc resistance-associated protein